MAYTEIDGGIKIRKVEDLIDLPQTILVNEFTEKSAKAFREEFTKAVNTKQKIIPIVIDSYGGQVYSLLSMIAVIKASPVPVATIGSSKMMSAGSILLSCGTEGHRYADPLSTMMIHSVSSWTMGKITDLKADVREAERLNDTIFKIMAQNIGKPEDYFFKLIDEHKQADLYLNPDEMKAHNIVNHIRIPSFKVKVGVDISFA